MERSKRQHFTIAMLWLLLGFSVSQAINFYQLASYEDAVFAALVEPEEPGKSDGEAYALQLLHRVHSLVEPRFAFFHNEQKLNRPAVFVRSPLLELNDGTGACGSFSVVLARAFLEAGMPARIA